MKPKLIFLLSLTFLFLFSGSVYGGVFDKTDGVVVLSCDNSENTSGTSDDTSGTIVGRKYFVINLKDKVIKATSTITGLTLPLPFAVEENYRNYEIVKDDEVFIKGKGIGNKSYREPFLFITKHEYEKNIFVVQRWKDEDGKRKDLFLHCTVGEKKF